MDEPRLKSFLEGLSRIKWFSRSGEPFQDARTVPNMQSAWDGEGSQMYKIWWKQSHSLETAALGSLNDQDIDRIFCAVSDEIGDALFAGLVDYLDRVYDANPDTEERTFDEAVVLEVIESVKRDVSWAGVEHMIAFYGFFTTLLEVYRRGRWVCSWDGDFPDGRMVLL